MNLNTKQIVSISDANQNFSRVARMAEKHGELYIFKNNKPKYKLVDIESDTTIEMSDDEKNAISHRAKALEALLSKLV